MMNNKKNANNNQQDAVKIRKHKNLAYLLTCEITAILLVLIIDVLIFNKEFENKTLLVVFLVVLASLSLVALITGSIIAKNLAISERRALRGNYNEVNTGEVLLKVENLSQHFGPLKAVDRVSFDVKKGEVFGLVGESGCGKTTTGRTIIKLYDATGGDVYFKGHRIVAGTLAYKTAIAEAKQKAKMEIAQLKADTDANPYNKEENKAKIAKIRAELDEVVLKNMIKIDEAKLDNNHADRDLVTQIQMIFQDPIASLDPRMTVRDIIAEGLVINGVTDKDYINEKVYEILERVGLVREHADRYPHEFSGGQRQRIGIARAVVMQPEMIIADEPVSALDVSVQAQVINLLNDLKDSMGLTILFIAHDLSVVKYFSDRIGVMYFGQMVELADSDELFKNPIHPYTKSLLSAIPLPDPIYEKQRTRVTYNPLAEHDYSVNTATLREITPGHFVHCNDAEEKKYRQMISN